MTGYGPNPTESAMTETLAPRQRPQPLYAQIKDSLRGRIIDGTFGLHDRLPSENELMSTFGVSRITVRQALGDLEKERVIFKIPGKGSFVATPRPFEELARLQGFGEAMARLGYQTHNRVVGIADVTADATVGARLALPPGAPVVEIRRVRYVEHEAISYDHSYFPAELGDRLRRADLASRDIFHIIENDCGIALGHAELAIDATLASEEHAALLGCTPASPILRIERLAFARDGRPLDFEHLYFRGESFRYQLRVERGNPTSETSTK
jgi:GntR family transcriptional regulator